jgi:hypothetical protein
LTAVPKPDPPGHWRFIRWDGGDCGSTPTCTIEALDGYFFPTAVFEDHIAPTITPTVEYSSTRDRTVTLGWTANEWASVTCTLDGSPLLTCPDSQSLTLPEGSHTFTVRGSDLSENLASPVQKPFRILDTVLLSGPPSVSNFKTATFKVSTGMGTSFDCLIDARYVQTCATRNADGTGTLTLPDLAEGQHTLRIYARDGLDDDPVPIVRAWTVDTIAPAVSLTAGADATFSFASNEPEASFECQLDDEQFTPCVTGLKPTLSPGEHRIAVRAVDPAGNVSASVTHTWSIAAPTFAPPAVKTAQPRPKSPALSTIAGKRFVSTKRTVDIAKMTCPTGVTCALTTPKTATLTIAHKRYTVSVTKTTTRVTLKLTTTAYAKLKRRTGHAAVTISATAPGAPPTTLTVNATIQRRPAARLHPTR